MRQTTEFQALGISVEMPEGIFYNDLGYTNDVSKTLEMLATEYSDDKIIPPATKEFIKCTKDWDVPNAHFSFLDNKNNLESTFIFYKPCKIQCTDLYNRALIETYVMAEMVGLSPLEETMRDDGWTIPEGFLDNVEDTVALSIFGANYALSKNGMNSRLVNLVINYNNGTFLSWLDLIYGDFEERDLKSASNKIIYDLVALQ